MLEGKNDSHKLSSDLHTCTVSSNVNNTRKIINIVDRGFCPARSLNLSVPKKDTEACINYKLVDLLAQAFLLTDSCIIH